MQKIIKAKASGASLSCDRTRFEFCDKLTAKMKSKFITPVVNISFILLPLTIVLLGVLFYKGYKEDYSDYFYLAGLSVPIITLFITKAAKEYLTKAFLGLMIVIIATEIFWGYKDKPWFSPSESYSCDGPCYGWFSF